MGSEMCIRDSALLLPSATAERCLAVYCSGWTGGLPGSSLNGRYVPDDSCCDEFLWPPSPPGGADPSPPSPPYYISPPSPPDYIDPSPPSPPSYMDPPSSAPSPMYPYFVSPPTPPMARRLLWERRLNHDGGGGEHERVCNTPYSNFLASGQNCNYKHLSLIHI